MTPSPNADTGALIEPRCPVSKSGMCLQMVEGFAPCDDVAECEYAPSPDFRAQVAKSLAPIENLIESMWERLDELAAPKDGAAS